MATMSMRVCNASVVRCYSDNYQMRPSIEFKLSNRSDRLRFMIAQVYISSYVIFANLNSQLTEIWRFWWTKQLTKMRSGIERNFLAAEKGPSMLQKNHKKKNKLLRLQIAAFESVARFLFLS